MIRQLPLRSEPPPVDDPEERWWEGELRFLFPIQADLVRALLERGDVRYGRGPVPATLRLQANLFGWTAEGAGRPPEAIGWPIEIPLGKPRPEQ